MKRSVEKLEVRKIQVTTSNQNVNDVVAHTGYDNSRPSYDICLEISLNLDILRLERKAQ